MKKIAIVPALALVLASCTQYGGAPTLPPITSFPSQVSMAPASWHWWQTGSGPVFDSPTLNASGSGFTFNFTSNSGPYGGEHYVVTQAPQLSKFKTLTMSGSVSVNGTLGANDYNDHCPCSCRAYFQEEGDNLSGQTENVNGQTINYQYYRWWSNPLSVPLKNGELFDYNIPLTPDQWSSVEGEFGSGSAAAQQGFAQALANPVFVGITCGGSYFFGHGVYVQVPGTASFTMTGFGAQ